jgi:hypothetical protein
MGLGMGIVLAAAAAAQAPQTGGIVWEKVRPELDAIRQLEERHDALPRWALFGTTRKENREKIDRLMNEVVDILGISPAADMRAEIASLEARNREDAARIAELRERRIAAPDEALFGDTIARIDAEVRERQEAIGRRDAVIAQRKGDFAGELASMGIDLSREQVDFLLATVVGDNVFDISIAFYNVKLITAQLESLTAESLESIEIARRYYGMYTVLLQTLDTIYDEAVGIINDRYLVGIEDIIGRTRQLTRQTETLLRSADPQHRAALEANVRAQELALHAAETYRTYLEQQRMGILEAQRRLRSNIEVAQNTYETVKISGDLLQVMRASDELFALLFELQVPDLRPFENLELRREFEKLTTRLRAER